MARDGEDEAVRFLDILTMASSIARSRGADAVTAAHLLDALAVLTGAAGADVASGPVSPLARPRAGLAADPAARELTQRWFARLGGAPEAALDAGDLAEFRGELEALVRL